MYYVIALVVGYLGFMVWAMTRSFEATVTEPLGYDREKKDSDTVINDDWEDGRELAHASTSNKQHQFADIDFEDSGVDFIEDDMFYDDMWQ